MLQGIAKAGQSWIGRIVVAIMFGFLIVSFAIWGIGDIFRGGGRTEVAKVGSVNISAQDYRTAYQSELQNVMRQARRAITPEQARAIGLDQRVLARLVTQAALDQRARALGLGLSDQAIARSILDDPELKNSSGQFDRTRFLEVLRENNLTEASFVAQQRATLARLQIAEAVTGALPVPLAAREALHRYQAERRAASYFALTGASLGDLPAATPEQLTAFFNERKASYRAPEYRALNALLLDPKSLAKPADVTDEEARTVYEAEKVTRFGTPEKRSYQQLSFASPAEAEAAAEKIKGGETFESLAAEQKVDAASLNVGTYARSEMLDPVIAEAVFSLPDGGVSAPLQSRFGSVLVRVTKIETQAVKPFEAVEADVKNEVALRRAREQVSDVHDAIEDQRAGAMPLAQIASQRGLPLTQVAAVDKAGLDKAGQPVAMPDAGPLVAAAFNSDIGADTEALSVPGGGYVWFEVTGVEQARDRTFDEVKDQVAKQWRTDEIRRRLAEKAQDFVNRLEKGETIGALANEAGVPIKTASDLARNAAGPDQLTAEVIQRIFATPVGKAASASAGDDTRVVFKVTDASVTPFMTSTQEASGMETQLRQLMTQDLLTEYIAQVQKDVGVSVNEQNLRRAVGGGDF